MLLEAISNRNSARKPGILLPSRPDILHWTVLNSNLVRDLQYRSSFQAKVKLGLVLAYFASTKNCSWRHRRPPVLIS